MTLGILFVSGSRLLRFEIDNDSMRPRVVDVGADDRFEFETTPTPSVAPTVRDTKIINGRLTA